ncbi:MAG: nuclear transport factor 2 family protein [Gemmatimonadales bacterium]
MTHSNVHLVESFYTAFQRRDAAAMGACYAPTISFRDPVFVLEGWRVGAMWRMLCERGVDLRIEARNIQADDTRGGAHWEAWYTFRATGRRVHNVIEAGFVFSGGRIVEHQDRFDLHRWAGQALGLKGRLLGWTPPVQRAIRGQAARALDDFIRKHGLT